MNGLGPKLPPFKTPTALTSSNKSCSFVLRRALRDQPQLLTLADSCAQLRSLPSSRAPALASSNIDRPW